MELVRVTVPPASTADESGDWPRRLGWACGKTFTLPASVLAQLKEPISQDGILHPSSLVELAAKLTPADVLALREKRAYIAAADRPASSRLPFSYHQIPGPLRSAVANLIGRLKARQQSTWAQYPCWPIDLSTDFAATLIGLSNPLHIEGKTPVILTHDLDSAEGLENAVGLFCAIEEAVGARSVNFIVPKGWPLNFTHLDQLAERGHEIGIHGYDHANLTAHAEPRLRRTRLDAARDLIRRYGITGYRAPSLVRTPELLSDLAGLYLYDSSIPTSGGLFPSPNNGSATARPYRIGDVWELPLSMPRDGSLKFLGYSPVAILDLWIRCASDIADAGGVVVLLTHCEFRFSGEPKMLRTYQAFLETIARDRRFVFSGPAAVIDRALAIESERLDASTPLAGSHATGAEQ